MRSINDKVFISTAPTRAPNPYATSKVYVCGDVIDVTTVERPCRSLSNIRRLSKDLYVDVRTGEVSEYRHSEKRADNHRGLYKTFANLRRIINLNFRGGWWELFLTLTYGIIMTDPVQLYKDFVLFWKKLRYYYPLLQYVVVAEPQHNGSWHLHVLLRNADYKYLYIPKEQLSRLWPSGFVHVKRLHSVDNLGAYFTAHLTDIDLSERDDTEEPLPKKIQKGARIALYPARFKLYRCSKGISRPLPRTMTYAEVQELVDGLTPCYSCTKVIRQRSENGSLRDVNAITYEQYNKKQKI